MRLSVALSQWWVAPIVVFSLMVFLPWSVRGAENRAVATLDGTAYTSHREPRLDLQWLIGELEGKNSEIKVASQRWKATKAVVPSMQALLNLRIQFWHQRMSKVGSPQSVMHGFGQEIPAPGELSLRGDIAQRSAERLEQEYHPTQIGSIAQLKRASFDRYFIPYWPRRLTPA